MNSRVRHREATAAKILFDIGIPSQSLMAAVEQGLSMVKKLDECRPGWNEIEMRKRQALLIKEAQDADQIYTIGNDGSLADIERLCGVPDPISLAIADDIAARASAVNRPMAAPAKVDDKARIAELEQEVASLKAALNEKPIVGGKTMIINLQQFGRVIRKEDRAAVQLAIVKAAIYLSENNRNTSYSKEVRARIKRHLAKELADARCKDTTETISRVVQGVRNV